MSKPSISSHNCLSDREVYPTNLLPSSCREEIRAVFAPTSALWFLPCHLVRSVFLLRSLSVGSKSWKLLSVRSRLYCGWIRHCQWDCSRSCVATHYGGAGVVVERDQFTCEICDTRLNDITSQKTVLSSHFVWEPGHCLKMASIRCFTILHSLLLVAQELKGNYPVHHKLLSLPFS
jgi:hypothetical protein